MVRFYIPLRCWLELFVSASKHSVVTNGSPLTSWKSNTQKIADCKKTWKIVSASKHGVVQHNSFSVMISTSLFEALFSSRFQTTLLRQIFWPGQEMVYHWCIFLMMIVLRHLQLVLCRGLFEFDDIIHNSFGCMLGTLAGNEVLLLYKKIGEYNCRF